MFMWILRILILMILYFKSSEHMEAAYGFSITITMLMTTLLLTYFLLYKIKWNKFIVYPIITLFLIIETAFFIANIVKIKERWQFLIFELLITKTGLRCFKQRLYKSLLIITLL